MGKSAIFKLHNFHASCGRSLFKRVIVPLCRSQAMFLSCILAFNAQGKSGGRNLEIEGCRF